MEMEPKEFWEDMNWGERELYKNFRCWEYWEKELEEWKMRLEVLGVIR